MSDRVVFTYRNMEDAKPFIGKKGVFSDNLRAIHSGQGFGSPLKAIRDNFEPFLTDKGIKFQFFSPNEEKIEKWIPFSKEDLPALCLRPVREKTWRIGECTTILGWDYSVVDGPSILLMIGSDVVRVPTPVLLKDYEGLDGFVLGKLDE